MHRAVPVVPVLEDLEALGDTQRVVEALSIQQEQYPPERCNYSLAPAKEGKNGYSFKDKIDCCLRKSFAELTLADRFMTLGLSAGIFASPTVRLKPRARALLSIFVLIICICR